MDSGVVWELCICSTFGSLKSNMMGTSEFARGTASHATLKTQPAKDPFGRDINDLPTDQLAGRIKENINEILL